MTSDRDALELRVLRALCACTDLAPVRDAVLHLEQYTWSDTDRQVVFNAILGTLERGAIVTPENLIVIATRAGFPDVNVDVFFGPGDNADLETALRKLAAAS